MSSVSTEQQQICARNYPQIQKARRNLKHLIIWKRWKFLLAPITTNSNGETWCKIVSAYSNNCPMTRSYPSYALTLVWALSKKDKTSSHLIQKKEIGCNIYAENTQCLDAKKKIRAKGWILKNTRIRSSLGQKSLSPWISIQYWSSEWVSVSRPYSILGSNRQRNWQVRDRSGATQGGRAQRDSLPARPQLKPAVTLSSVLIPVHGRKWIDIETQRSHDQQCYQTSKVMTRLLRHDQTVPREIEEAVLFDDVLEECRKKKFDGASQWSLNDWKLFKITVYGCNFKARSGERIAIFTKHGHMLPFSTTHCLPFLLRKRYVWKRRRSST